MNTKREAGVIRPASGRTSPRDAKPKDETQRIQKVPEPTADLPDGVPHWENMKRRVMERFESHAYHHVNHTETYNKPWVDGEKQMTLEEIGRHVEFIKRCMGMIGVALLAVLLITLLK